MRRLALALCVLAGIAAAATAGGRDRIALYRAGDLDELRRAAAAMPIDRLAAELGRDRVTTLAAVTALAPHPDADAALVALAAVAGGWDRSLVVAATGAARTIAAGIDGDRAIRDDLDDDELATAAAAWAALAARPDRWSDVRASALIIAVDLTVARAATADAPPDVASLVLAGLDDDDPALRLAAIEASPAPIPPAIAAALAARIQADGDPRVRLVAAAVLCGDDPQAALTALGDAGRAALPSAITVDAERAGAILAAARCLAADGSPAALRTLVELSHRAPRVVRGPLARLVRTRP